MEEPQAETMPAAEEETTPPPDWLKDVADESTPPEDAGQPPEWLPEVEEPAETPPQTAGEWVPEAEMSKAPPEAAPQAPPPTPPKPKAAPKAAAVEDGAELEKARQTLSSGDLNQAIDQYAKLIKRGKNIEPVIKDLNEALRRHPVDVTLWQTLGDAFMRQDKLQEALDAYTKAEELL
jgi:tetratricopeptide (TPR) repeat protein